MSENLTQQADHSPLSSTPLQWDMVDGKLKRLSQWLLYRLETDRSRGGKPAKVPYQVNGRRAKTNVPSTWASFEDVRAAFSQGGFDGIGFVFTPNDPFVGIDIDHLSSPEEWEQAMNLIEFLGSYAEISPSGQGAHIIAEGKLPEKCPNKAGRFEAYDQKRFFCMTGNVIGAFTVIQGRQGEIDAFSTILRHIKKDATAATGEAEILNPGVTVGNRHGKLMSLAGELRNARLPQENILATVRLFDRVYCHPPIQTEGREQEIVDIVHYVMTKEAGGSCSGGDDDDRTEKESVAQTIIRLASQDEFFHDANKVAFVHARANDLQEIHRIDSKWYIRLLRQRYFVATRKPLSASSLRDALDCLEARALFEGQQREVFHRIGAKGNVLFLDLGDGSGDVVRIDQNGWEIVRSEEIFFIRFANDRPIERPVCGGSLTTLKRFVNVDDEGFILVIAWLLSCFLPGGPFVIAVVLGEHGSAKSTLSKLLKMTIDPTLAPLRSMPKNDRDLGVSVMNSFILCFDNQSRVSPDMSDHLCQISFGMGMTARALYTNDEQHLLQGAGPIILNGIEDFITRPDLADRSIKIHCRYIPPEKRITEDEFWSGFQKVQPEILGALLDAVSVGLRRKGEIMLASLPRMADFARWIVACEPALPWPEGEFMRVYAGNISQSNSLALEGDSFAQALLDWLSCQGKVVVKTAAEILKATSPLPAVQSRYWPQTPRAVTSKLQRLAPALRAAGWDFQPDGHDSHTKVSRYRFTRNREMDIRNDRDPRILPHLEDIKENTSFLLADVRSDAGDRQGSFAGTLFEAISNIVVPE